MANQSYPMPPPSADLATTWAFLEEGVDHIMTKLQTGVSYSKYMSLYTVAYNYCTSSKMHGTTSDQVGMGNRSMFVILHRLLLVCIEGPHSSSRREPHGLRFIQQSHTVLHHAFKGLARCTCPFDSYRTVDADL
jgi:hypothetical protein